MLTSPFCLSQTRSSPGLRRSSSKHKAPRPPACGCPRSRRATRTPHMRHHDVTMHCIMHDNVHLSLSTLQARLSPSTFGFMTRKSLLNDVILAVMGCSNNSCRLSCHQALIDETVQRHGGEYCRINEVGSCYPFAKDIKLSFGHRVQLSMCTVHDRDHITRGQALQKIYGAVEVIAMVSQIETCKHTRICGFGWKDCRFKNLLKPFLLKSIRGVKQVFQIRIRRS